LRERRPHDGQKYVVATVNQQISTTIGTNVTQKNRSDCGFRGEYAIGMPAPMTRIPNAIIERRNHSVFDVASGLVRMIHNEAIPRPAHAMKYAMMNG
jgi:hypothetical protein